MSFLADTNLIMIAAEQLKMADLMPLKKLLRTSRMTRSMDLNCLQHTVHTDAVKDTMKTVAVHKVACWPGNTNN